LSTKTTSEYRKFKIRILQMTSNGKTIKIKVVDLKKL
jgi:hypothetical protein